MGKKLSTILSEFAAQFTALDGKIGGINVVKDSALKYHVEDSEGNQIGAAIEIAQDTFLDDVNLVEDYNEDGPALHFTFNAASGKQEIYVPVKKLVDVYNGDDTTIVKNGSTFSVKDGVFASAAQGAKADTALQTIENGTDGDYVDLVISAKGEGETKQTLTVSLTIQAVETASETSKGLAEAKAIEAKGLAEAEAMEKKAEAYAKYNKAAVAEMMIGVLPEIAAKVAEPLSQIDKITIIGGGEGSNGVDQVAGNVPVVMAKVFEAMKQATGIDMANIINADSYDAKVNRNINVTGVDDLKVVVSPEGEVKTTVVDTPIE